MVVYQSPQCGCCEDWITYMKQTGFEVKEQVKTAQMNEVKEKFHIPQEAMGCHTAVIGDYAVEGHVPPQEVRRLLQERPSAVGIAVAGMPMGSYGMDYDSREEQYDVLLILPEGKTEVYATYKGKNKIENAESSNSKD
ncbi:hypothetical protein CCZ01_05855 [Helicobacter monodelphidis]|nr:hypothetical protein CCZ01_05855 [Helicobacter sp. 15-1451]